MTYVNGHAVVAILRRGPRVLVIRRGPDTLLADNWCPPSGRLEPGETQDQALVREIREELGLAATPVAKVWECPTDDGTFLLHWWIADARAGEPVPDPREVAETRWVTPEEFLHLDPTFQGDRTFFEEILPALPPPG